MKINNVFQIIILLEKRKECAMNIFLLRPITPYIECSNFIASAYKDGFFILRQILLWNLSSKNDYSRLVCLDNSVFTIVSSKDTLSMISRHRRIHCVEVMAPFYEPRLLLRAFTAAKSRKCKSSRSWFGELNADRDRASSEFVGYPRFRPIPFEHYRVVRK